MDENNNKKIEVRAKRAEITRNALKYLLLTIWAVLVLFPFYWMILTSVKSYSSYNSEYVPKFFTLSPTIQNYVTAFTAVPLARYFFNTFIFTVVTTFLMMIVVILSAFAFARLDFKGKDLVLHPKRQLLHGKDSPDKFRYRANLLHGQVFVYHYLDEASRILSTTEAATLPASGMEVETAGKNTDTV